MTERVSRMLDFMQKRTFRKNRKPGGADVTARLEGLTPAMRSAKLFAFALAAEQPVLYGKDDLFGFNRYNRIPPFDMVYGNPSPRLWRFGNVVIDYATVLRVGIDGIADDIRARYDGADTAAKTFYDAALCALSACKPLIAAYRTAAEQAGNTDLAAALRRVPENGATDYYEALITVKFLQYILRLNQTVHIPFGRFDKYMKPYFDASVAAGRSTAELLELTELFFLSVNFDTDTYQGLQQGDNGQSMVLGGQDENGNDVFSDLSEICLTASEELKLIDPKINLRVNGKTPLALYERGTRLTKQGLGFPQYSNDDVVIPALVDWGYELRDARDYALAACWEFISSGVGADVPNIACLNFPAVVERAVDTHLEKADTFPAFLETVDAEIQAECDRIVNSVRPDNRAEPLLSCFIRPCIARGRDVADGGAKYNNYGVHGAGVSTAADALAAIRRLVFEEKSISVRELLDALHSDFAGYEPLRRRLLACPKMGNNDDYVDSIGCFLTDSFAKHLNGRLNGKGGIFRAGTGSALEYVRAARKTGATADGRHAGREFACSYSPSLIADLNGPLSAVQSFTKADLKKVCNGGPFTIEIHDTVFRNAEGERKVAMLIKTFIDRGGHQIQINAINRDRLLDAQKHPENHPNLIVRVWGWSGYFTELDPCYQNQIIQRAEFT